jgi:hypothetical protein
MATMCMFPLGSAMLSSSLALIERVHRKWAVSRLMHFYEKIIKISNYYCTGIVRHINGLYSLDYTHWYCASFS